MEKFIEELKRREEFGDQLWTILSIIKSSPLEEVNIIKIVAQHPFEDFYIDVENPDWSTDSEPEFDSDEEVMYFNGEPVIM
jgi:hypothetical protein